MRRLRHRALLQIIMALALVGCGLRPTASPIPDTATAQPIVVPSITATAIPQLIPTPSPIPPTQAPATQVASPTQPSATVAASNTTVVVTIEPPTSTAIPPTAVPPTATPAIATPTAVVLPPAASATPTASAPAALTASQIAATALANAQGEQCVASGPMPAKGFIGDPVQGRALYVSRGCAACHGDQAQGNIGPKTAGTTLSFGAVLQQLREPRGVMQRYLPADQSDADECNVYIYLKTLK